jgi:hypothetical protein
MCPYLFTTYSWRPCLLLPYFHPRKMWGYVGIWCSPNTLKSPEILFPKNTLPWCRVFNLAKNTLEWRGCVGISWNYPRKPRTSKQPIGKIPGYEIIRSHPLKYPTSKQDRRDVLQYINAIWTIQLAWSCSSDLIYYLIFLVVYFVLWGICSITLFKSCIQFSAEVYGCNFAYK